MTNRQLYDFMIGQVAWYEKQNTFIDGQLEYLKRAIARSRKEDRDIAEYALAKEPNDPVTLRVFGGDYVGNETRKLMNERAKYYRERKTNNKRIAYYQKESEYYERYIG